MINEVQKHRDALAKLERQRILWLRLSAFVAAVVLAVVLQWNTIHGSKLQWIITSAGLTISVVWWYWTMSVIRQIITFRINEAKVLANIVGDVQDIKQTFTKK
jgi:K+/H+ antiporter YhaU regulatory subunit KhtT